MKKLSFFITFLFLASSALFAQVSINNDGAQPDPSAGLDIKFNNKGLLPPRMTISERNAINAPAVGLIILCTDCNTNGGLQMFMNGRWCTINLNQLPVVLNVSQSGLPFVNTILTGSYTYSDLDGDIEATSIYKWYRADNASGINEIQIPGATSINYTTVTDDVGKYIRFAVIPVSQTGDSPGIEFKATSYKGPITAWTCGTSCTINHVTLGSVAPVDKTVTYGTVTNIPGEPSKCWITSNLGADHQATAVNDATEPSAGWYWQFNRKQGYQYTTERIPNTTWIVSISESSNWITANDPCSIELGTTWRIPTYTEWYNIDNAGGWTTWTGPWGSSLKLHAAGYLYNSDGSLGGRGSNGCYWSSTQYDPFFYGWYMYFDSGDSSMNWNNKELGFSVRCIRDN